MPHPSHNVTPPKNSLGFRRREWLIALSLVVILSGVGYIAWNPSQRAANKRDAERSSDVNTILSILKDDYVAEGNVFIPTVAAMPEGVVMMVVSGSAKKSGCDRANDSCAVPVEGDAACIDLSDLVARQKLTEIPVAPLSSAGQAKKAQWDNGGTPESRGTGYTLERRGESTLIVRSCEVETLDFIEAIR